MIDGLLAAANQGEQYACPLPGGAMQEGSKLDRIVSVVLTIATVILVAFVVEGRLNRSPAQGTRAPRVERLRDWQSVAAATLRPLDDTTRQVKVAVFTDFECPFCRVMDSVVAAITLANPGKVARYIVHFPLPNHQLAVDAAAAFECAAEQGKASEMHHALYAAQKTLSPTAWRSIARDAGVSNISRFDECLPGKRNAPEIVAGVALGEQLTISGTPAFVINGWLFDAAGPATITQAIAAAMAGRSPKP